MLDFCAQHGIGADVEVVRADQINEAFERVLKSDVRYRFVTRQLHHLISKLPSSEAGRLRKRAMSCAVATRPWSSSVGRSLLTVRIAFLFLTVYVIRALDRRPERLRRVSHGSRIISGLSGFRGVVSLAVVLSVPAPLDDGTPFPTATPSSSSQPA